MDITQYSIVIVNLDPTAGREIQKTRPCLVISPDEMNRHLQTIIVAPIKSSKRKYPTRIVIRKNKTSGMVAIDQIRTIDRSRVIKSVGKISKADIDECKQVIRETFVD